MTRPGTDNDTEPKQSVQSAWVLRLRREAERLQSDDMSRITFIGLLLATYTDAEGGDAWPAPATLAGISGYSEDMVRRCITALIGVGMLLRRRRQGKTSLYQLLVPLGAGALNWAPHLLPFEAARQAAATRRARSASKAAAPVATGSQNTGRDGAAKSGTPVASGNPEHPSRRGTQDSEHPSRRPQNTRRDGDENTRRVGGVPIPASTYGRDPDSDHTPAWPVVQPQVGAREAEGNGISSPGLHSIEGGGRGGGAAAGQGPLLLPVQDQPAAPAAAESVPPDLTRIADHMSALYGVVLPRRFAAPIALDILRDLVLPDPTAYVIAALDADPGRYRPAALATPDTGRAAGTA